MNTEMLICNVANELVLSRPLNGKDLRLIRSILGLTQAQFAERLGYGHDHIARMEKAADKTISKKVVWALRDNVINTSYWVYQKDLIEGIENTIRKDAGY